MKIKHLLSIILALALSFGLYSFAFAEGDSEVSEGYTPIYTAEDLYNIRNNLSGKYVLMNDIDLSVYENWEPIGTREAPFTGELDGNGCLIRNMKIEKVCSDDQNYIGLFGIVQNVPLKSVVIENGYISVSEDTSVQTDKNICVGMIAGAITGTARNQIRNSSATGSMCINRFSEVSAGGLVGRLSGYYSAVFSSNYTDIEVNTVNAKQTISIAGIVGTKGWDMASDFDLMRVSNYGNITIKNKDCSNESNIYVAGITNCQFANDTATNCLNKGKISFESSLGQIMIGGIIGDSVSRIEKCCNLGEIKVPTDDNDRIGAIGAFMGQLPSVGMGKSIFNCYYSNENTEPYFKEETDINSYGVNVVYVSESETYSQASFDALDFEMIWEIEETEGLILTALPVINAKETLTLETGKSEIIKNGEAYTSFDEAIATVNENGEVVALSVGETVITVELEYGYSYEYTVTVTEPEVDPEPPVDDPENPTEPDEECCIMRFLKQISCIVKIFIDTVYSFLIKFFN